MFKCKKNNHVISRIQSLWFGGVISSFRFWKHFHVNILNTTWFPCDCPYCFHWCAASMNNVIHLEIHQETPPVPTLLRALRRGWHSDPSSGSGRSRWRSTGFGRPFCNKLFQAVKNHNYGDTNYCHMKGTLKIGGCFKYSNHANVGGSIQHWVIEK